MTHYLSLFVLVAAVVRGLVVMDGLLFMVWRSGRHIRWGRSMKIAFAEPFLLLLASGYLWGYGALAPMAGAYWPLIAFGAVLSCAGLFLFGWSFVSYRTVGTGHYVDEDHQLVNTGAYGLVRHPMYCAAVFIWLGLALGHTDWALLTMCFAYVIPAYYFYAREEETMMTEALGRAYSDYAARVPMLFPGPLTIWE
jgi:protein-S-isoprenylcysteine O-methyltransferase Ste14